MTRSWMKFFLSLVIVPLLAVGCGDDGLESGTSEVTLLLTDAAGEHVDNVWIEIVEIYLQGTGGRQTLFTPEDGEALGLVELTDLADETLGLVADVEVPAGSYGQLRFVIGSAVLESDGRFFSFDGAVPPGEDPGTFQADGQLNCPSCTQTGIKALLPQDEAQIDVGSTILVLDFDVARSFGQEAGMSGMWVMAPVIVVTELGFSGTITGSVALAEGVAIPECPAGTVRDITLFEATATAASLTDENGDPVVFTDSPDANGALAFEFLEPDSYTMGFTSPLQLTDTHEMVFEASVSPANVTVSSGDEVSVGYEITSATCQEIATTNGG